MLRAIWYHLCNLKNVKNTNGGVLLLVKLQASSCNIDKCNTPPWVFFTFFRLHKWYQIAQRTAMITFMTRKDLNFCDQIFYTVAILDKKFKFFISILFKIFFIVISRSAVAFQRYQLY